MVTAIRDILNDSDKIYEVTKIAFDCVDIDKSGYIDENELEKVLSQISGDMGADPPTKEDVKEVFKYLDTDHSGTIEFTEFQVLIKDVLECMIQSDER
jgi:Ca2+-binding EF-hand superfamily protein